VNRRTTIALIMLLLFLLSFVVLIATRPPIINVVEIPSDPEPSGKLSTETDRMTPLDDGKPPIKDYKGSLTEEPKAIIRVINHTGWLNEGIYEVIGEVENTGALIARGVSFHIIFKDGLFRTLIEVDGPADKTTIGPGDKSTFKIKLDDKEKSELVGSYIVVPQIKR